MEEEIFAEIEDPVARTSPMEEYASRGELAEVAVEVLISCMSCEGTADHEYCSCMSKTSSRGMKFMIQI